MPRRKREESPIRVYHVLFRGLNLQDLFVDDEDRERLKRMLADPGIGPCVWLLAWCFMDNHVHLLLQCDLEDLSSYAMVLQSTYARQFNERHGRTGALFGESFYSEPAKTESHMLAALRFIHQNPNATESDGFRTYKWSSYREYLDGAEVVATDLCGGMFENAGAYKRFHDSEEDRGFFLDVGARRFACMSDEEAGKYAERVMKGNPMSSLRQMPRSYRDELLCRLKEAGMQGRQIARITGLSATTVCRAKHHCDEEEMWCW